MVSWVRHCTPRHVSSFPDGFETCIKVEVRSVRKVNSRQELALAPKTRGTKIIRIIIMKALLRVLGQLSSFYQPEKH